MSSFIPLVGFPALEQVVVVYLPEGLTLLSLPFHGREAAGVGIRFLFDYFLKLMAKDSYSLDPWHHWGCCCCQFHVRLRSIPHHYWAYSISAIGSILTTRLLRCFRLDQSMFNSLSSRGGVRRYLTRVLHVHHSEGGCGASARHIPKRWPVIKRVMIFFVQWWCLGRENDESIFCEEWRRGETPITCCSVATKHHHLTSCMIGSNKRSYIVLSRFLNLPSSLLSKKKKSGLPHRLNKGLIDSSTIPSIVTLYNTYGYSTRQKSEWLRPVVEDNIHDEMNESTTSRTATLDSK